MPEYFALFSLLPRFDIDLKALEEAYFRLQRQYHPDRFTTKSPEERAHAMRQSVLVNDAYRTLLSPLKRAQYMLARQGIQTDTVKPSQQLLMASLEMRERLEETEGEGLQSLASENARLYQETVGKIASAFASGAAGEAAQLTLKLGYLAKAGEAIMQKNRT